MAAGDFTAGQLGDAIAIESEMMMTSRTSELSTSIVAAQAVMNHQDFRATELMTPGILGVGTRCVSLKVVAHRFCDIDVDTTPTVSCAVDTGTEAEAEALTLDKENLAKINFRVLDSQCNNVFTFEKVLAENMLKAKAKLEVQLSKLIVTELSTNADTPVASWFDTDGTVVNNTYVIDPNDWTTDLYADIRYAMALTKGNDPIIINGHNFYNESFLANFKGIACCDNDSVLLNGPYQMFYDLHNVDQTLGGKYSLAVDKNALIFWSAPDHKFMELGQPELVSSDTYLWWDTLPRLQYYANGQMNPIYVDVRMKRLCSGSGVQSLTYGWDVELVVRGVLSVNLANCDGYQGILKIKKDASDSVS